MSKSNSELMEQSETLYNEYGKPLEQDYWGNLLPFAQMAGLW